MDQLETLLTDLFTCLCDDPENPEKVAEADSAIHQIKSIISTHTNKSMTPITEIPEECPHCEGKETMTSAVDVTIYDDQHIERNIEFDGNLDPENESVRVYCMECGEYLKISDELAEKLVTETPESTS
jgi:hypothetical protein